MKNFPRTIIFVFLGLTFFVLAPSMRAQPTPLGVEFQVNSYTAGEQRFPTVAARADGGFIVVWQSDESGGTDTSLGSIQGQVFLADGSPSGGEFQINTYTSGAQSFPSIASNAAGAFVAQWHSDGSFGTDTSEGSIQAQRLDPTGAAVGAEFQVNSYTMGDQLVTTGPTIAMAADGSFRSVWTSFGSNGTDSSKRSVQLQSFDANGNPILGETQVNTYTTAAQGAATIATGPMSEFVVVWQSNGSLGSDGDSYSVQMQRYASNGAAQGSETQMNTLVDAVQGIPQAVYFDDGSLVAAWLSERSNGDDNDRESIQIRRFDTDGIPIGAEVQVNTYTTERQQSPKIAIDTTGDFVVTWHSGDAVAGPDDSSYAVRGRAFDANGSALGDEWQINSYTQGSQTSAQAIFLGDGEFVVVWDSDGSDGSDDDSFSIRGRRFRMPAADLAITKTSTPELYLPDDSLTYTIIATNAGDRDAPGSLVVDLFPEDILAVTWTCTPLGGASCAGNGAGDINELVDLPVGGTVIYTATGTVDSNAAGPIENTATITVAAGARDLDDSNNSATARTDSAVGLIFRDGFESGDVTAWSDVVP